MHVHAWLLYAIVALVFWGVTGVTQKLSTNAISSELSFLWFAYAMVVLALAVLPSGQVHWHFNLRIFLLAALGGTLNGAGALTSFAALERGGKASIVIPLVSLYPLLTIVLAVTFLHEKLRVAQVVGIVLALIAALLLSQESSVPATDSAT